MIIKGLYHKDGEIFQSAALQGRSFLCRLTQKGPSLIAKWAIGDAGLFL